VRSKLAWQAALATLALGLLTTRGVTTGDDAVHLELAVAIIERGETTLAIDPGELWVPSRALAGGLFYQGDDGLESASPPGHALLALPLVAFGCALAEGELDTDALFRESRAPIETVLRPIARDPRVIGFSLLGPISAALAVLFAALAMIELELSRRATFVGAAALAIGSPLLAYAGTGWTQLPCCALASLMLWGLARREVRSGASLWPLALGAAGIVIVRPELMGLSIAAVGALYMIERRWRRAPTRAIARVLVPIALAIGALAWWGLPQAGDGFSIARVPVGALGLLISPRTGLLIYAPFTALAAFGIVRLSPPLRMLASVWVAIVIAGYGGWFDWPASLAYGPRFLIPILPALALGLAVAFDASARIRPLVWIAVALGLVIQLPAALVAHVRIEEAESFFAPAFVEAWRTFGAIDCAPVVIYPALALVAALAGVFVSSRGST
jgi:hypothetical protein